MEPINRYLDAAVLKPETSRDEARAAIEACVRLAARTACVRPCDISLAQKLCANTDTEVCVVLGFPHGCQLSESKADEALRYCSAGVAEIDMVTNYSWIRSGDWAAVTADIEAVSAVTRPNRITLKVILETSFLSVEAITQATECAIRAQADFVKTSTGFGNGGATTEAVQAMVDAARGRIQVKASGGIRDRATAEHFIGLGATRLGVGFSACAAICEAKSASLSAEESY